MTLETNFTSNFKAQTMSEKISQKKFVDEEEKKRK